jgi:hypothetical protein
MADQERTPEAATDDLAVDRASAGPVAPSIPPSGPATGASGGYGTGSGGEAVDAESASGAALLRERDQPTSGGTGEGDAASSTAGEEAETDWLRSAPGGRSQ